MNHDLFYQAANTRALGSDRIPDVWSVSQVNALARQLLEGSIPPLVVAGEISGFRRLPAGHCFFTLKDREARLDCVMWRDDARRLPNEPPEGLAVQAFGSPTVYERAGRLQFVVRRLRAEGEGSWRVAFERIRRRLERDGLLDPARKRSLPGFPACVGVITSREGAAVRDIISVIRRRAPWTDVLLYPARVQGDGAAAEVARAIRHACDGGAAEVLIVGRGGGSVEDLWTFNDERVVRAIAAAAVPVISAVGHETDVTLADLVADHRAPTPSAAAEAAVPDIEALSRQVELYRGRLTGAVQKLVIRYRDRITSLEDRLFQAIRSLLEHRRLALDGLHRRLRALGPMAVLQRGYAVALDERGHVLRRATEIPRGTLFRLRLQDGTIRARGEGPVEEADG